MLLAPTMRAGVEAALQTMQRQQEAVAYCPLDQLCGAQLVPDPPGAAGAATTAAPAYCEIKLQLVDFAQVRRRHGGMAGCVCWGLSWGHKGKGGGDGPHLLPPMLPCAAAPRPTRRPPACADACRWSVVLAGRSGCWQPTAAEPQCL
jgi:hypothetical protein